MNDKPYNSVEFAKYIAAFWNEQGVDINMTKVQKLLYIAYGTWLVVYDKRLLDEYPQAWPYGPVFPTTRNKLLKLELKNITKNDVSSELQDNKDLEKLIKAIHNSYFGSWNASQLSAWSHKEGSAWADTVATPGFEWGQIIPDNLTKKWFAAFVNNGSN